MSGGHKAQPQAMSRYRRSHGIQTPTPTELVQAPELAALYALDELTQVALHALVAVHPELRNDEMQIPGYTPARSTSVARHIAHSVRKLEKQLRDYRTAIAIEQEQRFEADHDLPF
jgi:hypothetical protein